jgi:16S rRNA (uracil1498-N3)-methyltransferase
MNLFYYPDIKEPVTTLSEDESKHIIRVLRKKIGEKVHFTDGNGYIYHCTILEDHPKRCSIEILSKEPGDDNRNYEIHIALAPTKNIDRTEFFLEKSTEIGIDYITPITTFHSERRDVKHDRLNKVLISAMKQSLKSHLPTLHEISDFKSFIEKGFIGDKFIAFIDKDITLELSKAYKPGNDVLILIGPEGDFSNEEVILAKDNGFTPVSLGKSRLRTETAGIVACNTISIINDIAY